RRSWLPGAKRTVSQPQAERPVQTREPPIAGGRAPFKVAFEGCRARGDIGPESEVREGRSRIAAIDHEAQSAYRSGDLTAQHSMSILGTIHQARIIDDHDFTLGGHPGGHTPQGSASPIQLVDGQ